MNHSEPYLGYDGLNKITVSELKRGDQLFSMLAVKLQDLNPKQLQSQVLEERVRFLMEVLRETLADRYQALPVSAFAHILVALDDFLKVKDAIPDTRADGLTDDLSKLDLVLKTYQREFDDFRRWRARQP
jgi:hypothetical protein